MPFFGKKNVLFLHIPKTGGTSVEKLFMKTKNGRHEGGVKLFTYWKDFSIEKLRPYPISQQHWTFSQILETCPEIVKQNPYVFYIVRHPVDRFFSEYFYLQQVILNPERPKLYQDHCRRYGFSIADCIYLTSIHVFFPWILQQYSQNQFTLDGHFLPQWQYVEGLVSSGLDMKFNVNEYRFENLSNVLQDISQRFELDSSVLSSSSSSSSSSLEAPPTRSFSHVGYPFTKPKDIQVSTVIWSCLQTWYERDFQQFHYDPCQTRFPHFEIHLVDPIPLSLPIQEKTEEERRKE